MKKLCFITTVEATMESFVIPVMAEVVKSGYDVTLICSMSDEFLKRYSETFHCINVEMKRGYSISDMIFKPFEFYRIFKKEKFDYIQYATINASWYASVAAKISGIPVRVYCLWGLLYAASSGIKRKLYWLFEKVPCLFSNYFFVASHKNLDIAVDDRLCAGNRAFVIGDGGTVGVDLKKFDYEKRSHYRSVMIEKYPILKDRIVFGYLGRIDVDKGINELLSAFLSIDDPNIALLLIGPMDYLRSGLDERLLEKANNNKNIVFAGYTKDVAMHLSAVDVLVHPTYREGFSMAIQQAMAMGCAIITTDIPGPSEVIVDNESGLLVPAKDMDELRDAMILLKNDKRLRMSYVESGLQRVKEKFSRERMTELTIESISSKIN